MNRMIQKEVTVAAPVAEIWQAWTTEEGALTFFAPKANVELAIGGRYEMLFDPAAPPGSQGGEGLKILSYLPEEMLSPGRRRSLKHLQLADWPPPVLTTTSSTDTRWLTNGCGRA